MERKHNLLPEYVWMIFVGLLLAIIICMHIFSAKADTLDPFLPSEAGSKANYVVTVTLHGYDLYVGGTYITDLNAILQEGGSRVSNFESDIEAALTNFFDYYPKDQTTFFLTSDGAPSSNVTWLESFCSTRYLNYVPVLADSVSDWYLGYNTEPFPMGRFIVSVYVRKFLSATPTPSPSPVPPQDQYVDLYVGAPWLTSGSYFTQVGYYWLTFASNDFELDVPNSNNAFGLAYSNYNVFNPWKRSVLFSLSRGTDFLFYLYSDSISDIRIYFTGSAHYSDLNFVKENFSYVSFSVNDGWNFRSGSFSGLTGFQFLSDSGSILSSSLYVHDLGIISSWSNDSTDLNFNLNPSTVNNAFVQALRFGLDGAYVPEPTPDPNQPSPSPTQAPLPTSGESIHVILPSGTPTPTPPFTIQPGEGGGNGSPGSFGGNGLSSGETSGILQAFSMFVSDNPVFAFLGGLFSAFPAELMYPLYILLFILIILGIIRVFIHFIGG